MRTAGPTTRDEPIYYRMLNSILLGKNITKDITKKIYNSFVESVITYSSGVRLLKEKTIRTMKATAMDFWRKAAGKTKCQTNE